MNDSNPELPYKEGDVVRLRSNEDVKMTVVTVYPKAIECLWFDVTDMLHRGTFNPRLLIIAQDK